jgi:hypothetical protein
MPGGIYFTPETPPLRCGTNLPCGIYFAPATSPVRYGANLPFGIYLAPATAPLRHTLIAVVDTLRRIELIYARGIATARRRPREEGLWRSFGPSVAAWAPRAVVSLTATLTYPATTRRSAKRADIRITITPVAMTSRSANRRRIDGFLYTKP